MTRIASAGNSLVYSTYLGGSDLDDGIAIKVSNDYAYVAGGTNSIDFPLSGPELQTWSGDPALPPGVPNGNDIFLAQITPLGITLQFSTYLGGTTGTEYFGDMQLITGTSTVWITGTTSSTDFPTYGTQYAGGANDVFVTEIGISAVARLMTSHIIGGTGNDGGMGIDVDSDGNAYVTGYTYGLGFPLVNPPIYPPFPTGMAKEVFVMKITRISPHIDYSNIFGGSGGDEGRAIAVDSHGNMFVTGITDSDDFPLIRAEDVDDSYGYGGAYPDDIFVTAISSDGQGMGYSTYLSGTGDCHDHAYDIAVGGESVYVTGYTQCTDFPTTLPSLQTYGGGSNDVIVAKIDLDPDSDFDLIPDSDDNCPNIFNPNQLDTDLDAYGDACESCDNDPNKISPGICGCGIPDTGDTDSDGILNCVDNCPAEYNPLQEDGDGDGIGDVCDADTDSDNDGLIDSVETNTGLYVSPTDTGTDPNNPDTDGDGLSDGDEVNTYLTGPLLIDTDEDAINDGVEVAAGTNPNDNFDLPKYKVDDFYDDMIDGTKWTNFEFVRRIVDDGTGNHVFESAVEQYGSDASNNMGFTNPETIISIQADVKVTELDNSNAELRARIWGKFFNANFTEAEPGDGSGDVLVQVGLKDTGSGLTGYYKVSICDNDPCSSAQTLTEGEAGNFSPGQELPFFISYDEILEKFILQFGGLPMEYNLPPGTIKGPPKNPYKAIGTKVGGTAVDPARGGYIKAFFDNVICDNFSDQFETAGSMIDPAKWQNWEYVRVVDSHMFESAITQYDSNASNYLTLIYPQTITSFQTDMTVIDGSYNGAKAYATIAGRFFNDGTPGEGDTGDILAQFGAVLTENGLFPYFEASRCGENCNFDTEPIVLFDPSESPGYGAVSAG